MRRNLFVLAVTTAVCTVALPSQLSAQTYPSNKDPRSTLKLGCFDAGIAISNMKQVASARKPAAFETTQGLKFVSSDLAVGMHYVY